jgi:hypothetical protein
MTAVLSPVVIRALTAIRKRSHRLTGRPAHAGTRAHVRTLPTHVSTPNLLLLHRGRASAASIQRVAG